jgi:fatty-acyl-CoA synthase
VLPVVSLFHANAWGLPFAATFAGARLILCGAAPTPATTARLVREEHVTKIAAVPTVLLRLLEEPDLDLTSVEEVFVSGAAPPATLVDALENRYGARVVHAWGMTETGFFGLVSRPHPAAPFAPDSIRDLRLSQGRPAPLVDARINGNEGELEVRGPGVAGRAADVALDGGRVTRDGWLRTGDLATYWPFPYLKVVDRLHDTFKSGGEWIHTLELEEHLVAFPGVREAAVVAVPDERWGARPYAFVGVATRGDVNWEDVVAFLATRVPRWWVPDTFEILDRLPRTATGKIDKRALRATLATRPAPEGSRSGSGHVEHVPS